ncbi:hypothetical protein B0H16DRAFT_1768745 [Mycena metata]|uniref:Uncharacterized protein n=1 Tax=Mycena metata TaxID=1033252 RepID=A0AAD7JUI7_9AGAR|nr:hypothetical protein B0H16DRAFT_1768745 [Mycena metata]
MNSASQRASEDRKSFNLDPHLLSRCSRMELLIRSGPPVHIRQRALRKVDELVNKALSQTVHTRTPGPFAMYTRGRSFGSRQGHAYVLSHRCFLLLWGIYYSGHGGMNAVAVFTGGTGPVSGTPSRAVAVSASKNKRAGTGGKLAVHTRPSTVVDGRRRVDEVWLNLCLGHLLQGGSEAQCSLIATKTDLNYSGAWAAEEPV